MREERGTPRCTASNPGTSSLSSPSLAFPRRASSDSDHARSRPSRAVQEARLYAEAKLAEKFKEVEGLTQALQSAILNQKGAVEANSKRGSIGKGTPVKGTPVKKR